MDSRPRLRCKLQRSGRLWRTASLRWQWRLAAFGGTALFIQPEKIGAKNPPTLDSFLVTSNDRIGIVSITTEEFVEVSPQGNVLGRWPLPPLDGMVGGAAMTARESVLYLGIQSHGAPNRAIQNVYRFDKATPNSSASTPLPSEHPNRAFG